MKDTEILNGACKQELTMVFIENQAFGKEYEKDIALMRGTLFPDLDKPLTEKEVARFE